MFKEFIINLLRGEISYKLCSEASATVHLPNHITSLASRSVHFHQVFGGSITNDNDGSQPLPPPPTFSR